MKAKTNKKIRTGVRAGAVEHKGEAEVMNNPLYCGNETSGTNPLFV